MAAWLISNQFSSQPPFAQWETNTSTKYQLKNNYSPDSKYLEVPNTSSPGIIHQKNLSPQETSTEADLSLSSATVYPHASLYVNVSYEGIKLTHDTTLAQMVSAHTLPTFIDPSGFTYNDIPEHFRFDFLDSYTHQEPFASYPQYLMPWLSHQNLATVEFIPQIFVFPTGEFSGINQLAGERIEMLKGLLRAETLPSDGELPVLPTFNSTQDLRTQARLVDFQGGSGVRFITRYAQEATPVTNPAVFYTFQGLTEDGELYISAFFPVYVSSLPDSIVVEDWDLFNRQYQYYLKNITESLHELQPVDFVPDLEQLDALIQSITVHPAINTGQPLPETSASISASFPPYPEPGKQVANPPSRTATQPTCLPTIFDPIAFLPDNTGLIGRTNTGICTLNLETLGEESCIESLTEVVEAAISNDGSTLALAYNDHTIQLSDGQLINIFEGHSNIITALKFSPAGDQLFSASHDNWVKVWDRKGHLINSLLPGGLEVLGIGVSPDGTNLATISFEGPMKLWNLSNNQVIQEYESPYGAFDGAEVAFSPDGKIVARSIGGGPITLFNAADGTQIWSGGVYAVAFSPDGRFLAISDTDEQGENIVVLRSQDGEHTYMTLQGHQSIILKILFSPDSSVLASGDDLELKIWNVEDGQLIYSRTSTCP